MYHSQTPFFHLLLTVLPAMTEAGYPLLTSSFTWNQNCGPTVACGPSAAGRYGIGFAAANNATYAAGKPIIGGVGAGCGQCWHLQPISNVYTSNGLKLGTPVVVKINDQCTDPGYCDQAEGTNTANLNTKYGKQVHFDLCNSTGVTDQFFGQIGAGVVVGFAQQLADCSALDSGAFGSKFGTLGGGMANAGGVPESFSFTGKAGGVEVVPDASGTPNVGDAFQVSTAAVSSSAMASSSSVIGAIPSLSGSAAPASGTMVGGAGADSTREDMVDKEEGDSCEEL